MEDTPRGDRKTPAPQIPRTTCTTSVDALSALPVFDLWTGLNEIADSAAAAMIFDAAARFLRTETATLT